jgi:hypothetical protein
MPKQIILDHYEWYDKTRDKCISHVKELNQHENMIIKIGSYASGNVFFQFFLGGTKYVIDPVRKVYDPVEFFTIFNSTITFDDLGTIKTTVADDRLLELIEDAWRNLQEKLAKQEGEEDAS